jgi:hypothetical protein
VTLATEQADREDVAGKPFRKRWPKQNRQYQHTIVRVPLDTTEPRESEARGPSGTRRKHLVRGYMWGKNTRPQAEWRWIRPFWRGSAEVGIVERSHYVVG